MNKASSRIKNKPKTFVTKPIKASSRIKKKSTKIVDGNRNRHNSIIFKALKHYFKHLPTLFLSLFFGTLTFYFLKNISPESVRHFIIPNTYLPFLLLIFLTTLFLFSFVFLNTKIGLLLSAMLTTFLFMRVQLVVLDLWLLLPLVVIILFAFIAKITHK